MTTTENTKKIIEYFEPVTNNITNIRNTSLVSEFIWFSKDMLLRGMTSEEHNKSGKFSIQNFCLHPISFNV